ncbi:hypothetical protein [Lentisalinibacter orientalis]|uniref:hypothetical protein n=1 Tax=Lentisalinibacter orientalis TaxID=2992241 RepID=UPI00386A5DB7
MDQSRLRQLFDRALAVEEHDRRGWLDRACGDDADLRELLDTLLEAANDDREIIRTTVDSTVRSLLNEEDEIGDSGRYRALAGWINRLRTGGTTER